MAQLTKQLMIEYRKVFSVYSKDNRICAEHLREVVRDLGYNPREGELQVST